MSAGIQAVNAIAAATPGQVLAFQGNAASAPGLGARFLFKIVKNESMKTDPPEIYGWRSFMMACSACFGGMLFGFDIGTIGGVLTLPNFMEYVQVN